MNVTIINKDFCISLRVKLILTSLVKSRFLLVGYGMNYENFFRAVIRYKEVWKKNYLIEISVISHTNVSILQS